MRVAVLAPVGGDCPHRTRAWQWVRARYIERHPEWEIVEGTTAVDGYSRTQAILDARHRTSADVFVVADSDVWTDGIDEAVARAIDVGWSVPHTLIHRLSRESTDAFIAGADWRKLPLSTDNPQDSKPYKGHEAGTLLVTTAEAFDAAPPDSRFVGWGSEDDAWSLALRALVGVPWRGKADLIHLWHPPQPRKTRVTGNDTNVALLRRYRRARSNPTAMRALVEEAR